MDIEHISSLFYMTSHNIKLWLTFFLKTKRNKCLKCPRVDSKDLSHHNYDRKNPPLTPEIHRLNVHIISCSTSGISLTAIGVFSKAPNLLFLATIRPTPRFEVKLVLSFSLWPRVQCIKIVATFDESHTVPVCPQKWVEQMPRPPLTIAIASNIVTTLQNVYHKSDW